GQGRGMLVNLSVDTSSVDLMEFCKDLDAFYIDTVVEPWPGLYTNRERSISERSNYALRESVLDLRRRRPGGITAVSCCGANPGMVSWMVKQALIDICGELKLDFAEPATREAWARLMQRAGVRAWTPTTEAQRGFLVTHDESISLADYFTLREGRRVIYRPTCHYAYHPCDDAVLSLHELAGAQWKPQQTWHILSENDIVD